MKPAVRPDHGVPGLLLSVMAACAWLVAAGCGRTALDGAARPGGAVPRSSASGGASGSLDAGVGVASPAGSGGTSATQTSGAGGSAGATASSPSTNTSPDAAPADTRVLALDVAADKAMAPDLARDTPIDRGPDIPPDARKDTATPPPDSKSATPDSKPDRGPFLELLAGGLGGPGNRDGTGTAARFSRPIGLAVDEDGNLFIADSGNHTIRKMVLGTGQVTTLAGVSGESASKDGVGAAARFNYPNGLATDGAGNLFVADIQDQTIRKVVIATGQVTTLAGASEQMNTIDGIGREARFNAPASLVVDGSNLYVAEDIASGALRKINLKTSEVTTITLSAGKANEEPIEFSTPSGLVNDGAGHLYFVDSHHGTIYKMTLATGEVKVVAGVLRHQLQPWALAVGPVSANRKT